MQQGLSGKKVLVTRAAEQAPEFLSALRAENAEPIEVSLIKISEPDSWQDFDQALNHIEAFSWIFFASSNAVESSIERAKSLALEQKLKTAKIACIGTSTLKALQLHGLECAFLPGDFVAESLIGEFPNAEESDNKAILWPRTNIGRDTIKIGLENKGWQVQIVHSYKTSDADQAAEEKLKELLENRELDFITLLSSQTVRNLKKLLVKISSGNIEVEKELLSNIRFAVIGPETAKTCQEAFERVDIKADTYTLAGLIEAMKRAN
ncbi:MAG: uroporphyrinogen-III synthase [Candidatus Obscuribacterales bacterium]|nr:uroporphyrinogen-III synthase [Candidatus Obscuribacterales bacterium]